MSDRIQNTQKGREANPSRRRFFQAGLAFAGAAAANTVDLDGLQVGVQLLNSGLAVATDLRATRIANAQACVDDGKPEACVNTGWDLVGKSRFGGHYFEDNNKNGTFDDGDEAVQGVRGRRFVVGVMAPIGHDDFAQLDPSSAKEYPDGRVSFMDVKAGRNSGERFISTWDIFEIPMDPESNKGIGYSKRTGSEFLTLSAKRGDLVDKIYGKTFGREAATGKCAEVCLLEPQCVWTIVFGRALKDAQIDLNGSFPLKALRTDPQGKEATLFSDFIYGWKPQDADAHIDFNRINSVLTPALRKSDEVVKSEVIIPMRTVRYDNYSK